MSPFDAELLAALPRLRKVALRLTRDHDRASDLVQDTVERALSHRDRFQIGSNMGAWLCQIARNLYLDGRRRSWRQADGFDDLAASLIAADDPHAALMLKQALGALARMPREQSEAVLEIGLGGLKLEAYAAQAGCSLATVKRRLSEGRAQVLAVAA